jgi:hypothetical protein
VGSKTFILRDGLWLDTAYDPDTQTAQQIGFASDTYFDLLSTAPELGQYMALGQRVLFVYQDQVFEIVEGEGDGPVILPEPVSDPEQGAVDGGQTDVTTPVPGPQDPLVPQPGDEGGTEASSPRLTICASAFVMPLLLMVGLMHGRYAIRRRR